jgi:hypothetical protein
MVVALNLQPQEEGPLSRLNTLDQTSKPCKRREVRAGVMEASAGRDLMAAALLLRLVVILGEVQEGNEAAGRDLNGQRPNERAAKPDFMTGGVLMAGCRFLATIDVVRG